MNKFNKLNEQLDIPILKISREVEETQIKSLKEVKSLRNNQMVTEKLNIIENACKSNANLVPVIIDAVLEYATLGEIVTAMKNHFGEWTESSII